MLQRGGICDIRCQAFWTSVIENEEAMRRKWFKKNQDLLLENLKLEDEKLRELQQSRKNQPTKKSPEKRKKHVKKTVKSENSQEIDTINLSFMKPVDLKVKNILYERGVESFSAANNYFRERYKQQPVDRFNYQECSSWEIGWRLKDSPPIPLSQVGIRSNIQKCNASGLTRDPGWYRMCQTKNAKNFNEILTY